MTEINEKIGNLSRETETMQKNQMESVELKKQKQNKTKSKTKQTQ